MNPLAVVWYWLCAWSVYGWLRLGLYRWKSNLYRRVFEQRYAGLPVSTYPDLAALAKSTDASKWRSDSWAQLFDAVSSPNRVEAVWSGKEPVPLHGFDCDEFAIYLTAAITKSLQMGLMQHDGIDEVFFLTVLWMEKNGWLPNGHNVCLIRWADGTYSYMDYGKPSRRVESPQQVIGLVRQLYADGGRGRYWPLGWAQQKLDLTPLVVRCAK